jgi:hypothetical protein
VALLAAAAEALPGIARCRLAGRRAAIVYKLQFFYASCLVLFLYSALNIYSKALNN